MLATALCTVLALTPTAPGLTVDDMLAMERVSEATLSPDAKWVAFVLRTTDLKANRGRTDIWLTDVAGKSTRRLTADSAGDYSPQWMPDGKSLLFISTRSGSAQVWNIAVDGGEARQVTDFAVDVGTLAIAPDGQRLVMAMEVYPDSTLEETAARDKASDTQAKVYDELLFRHWDSWEDGKRSHVFAWDIGRGAPRDLMKGMNMDSPEHPFGGGEEVSISPDGKTVAFVGRNAGRDAAWSTNLDVWLAPIDGSAAPVALTAENKGADWLPVWSPDGKSLAVLSQARAGYESDKARIVIWDVAAKSSRVLTDAWDYSAGELAWSNDGKKLYTSADNVGNSSIFELDAKSGKAKVLVAKGSNSGVLVGKGVVVYTHDSLKEPAELWTLKGGKLTHFNDERVSKIGFGDYEQVSFSGAHGDTVHGYVVKPAGFVEGKKYPVAMLIHGGPQGSMGDHWHYRWNPQAFAGAGFAVVFIDFHGSTGYGQKFTDAIRGDWGGAPFEDLMKGLDFALEKYAWMDKDKQVAAGASYGGYMINWINGQTDRFKALVCHDGNLDERMAYFDTEELWFPEWDHQGLPWEADGYAKHNPIDHVAKWKTPTLVVHGGLDFRVVDTQGMSTFTVLQRRGIPSRFVYFPDENHWVLKPKNSQLWHREVLAWLKKWTQ